MLSLDCCAVEVMDSSMAAADGADSDSIANEDVPHGGVSFNLTLFADECAHDSGKAAGDAHGVSPEDSAALADDRCTEPAHQDVTDVDDCSGAAACLEACMTHSGQDYYLRRGGTPRRRSALRLSRLIARQQLLRRLSQGRNRDHSEIFVDFFLGPLHVIVHTEGRFKQTPL